MWNAGRDAPTLPAMPDRHHDVHFTLAEARKLLPKVRKKVEGIMQAARAARNGRAAAHGAHLNGVNGNGNGKHADPMETLAALAKELADDGIFLKDAERGLIDFPHIREDGTEVYLCWLAGEEDILFWHHLEDGFAGRQPIGNL